MSTAAPSNAQARALALKLCNTGEDCSTVLRPLPTPPDSDFVMEMGNDGAEMGNPQAQMGETYTF